MKTYNLAVQGARQIILAEIDEWRESLCSVCSNQNYHKSRCTSEASKQIIKLGEIYQDKDMAIRYAKGESIVKKVEKTLTVAEYQKFKSEGLSDRAIMDRLGWYHTKMNEWKHEHDLIGKQKRGPKKEKSVAPKQPKEDTTHLTKRIEELEGELKEGGEQFDLMYKKYIDLNNMHRGATGAIEVLTEELQEMEIKLGYASQWEDRYNDLEKSHQQLYEKLNKEFNELKTVADNQLEKAIEQEKEYRKLEVDYRNEVTETKRLKDMLGNLKYTEQINVYLMERHVGFMRQLDEVTE